MQYKVFIVDDEPMIRYGLVSCIQWEKEGLQLIGEASNGEAALKNLRNEHLDILITDIKMPLMDGLELTRRIKKQLPRIKVILVSSYSDFEYAREAVKLGVVVDYLLKPTMEPEDLLRIVKVCKQELDLEYEQIQNTDDAQENILNNMYTHLETQLKNLLSGNSMKLDWIPDWMKSPVSTVVWKQDYTSLASAEDYLGNLLKTDTAVLHVKQCLHESISFTIGDREFITIIAEHNNTAFMRVEALQKRLIDDLGLSFTVGVSPAIHQIDSLSEAYKWANYALNESFFGGIGRCYLGKIQSNKATSSDLEATSQTLNLEETFEKLRERFSKAYAAVHQEESEKVLTEVFAHWNVKTNTRERTMAQAQSLLTIMWSRNYKYRLEDTMKEIMDKQRIVQHVSTLQELTQLIKKQFNLLWDVEQVQIISEDAGGIHVIQLALSYIQENYRYELSLQEVADHVHMSKNYFSEQFKRRTGLNFIDFLIRLRIHYAKQLLTTTSLKIYDIGRNSGFNSPKHFMKMFKREVNCTPAEYRQKEAIRQDKATWKEDGIR